MITARRRLTLVGLEIGVTVAIVAAIWILTARSSSPYVPALSDIVSVFRKTWLFSKFGSDVVPSLIRLFAGFGIATVVGITIGIVLGVSRPLRMMAGPVVTLLRSVPPPLLVPVALVLLGIGDAMKISVIAFVCIWPIAVNTLDGVLGIDLGLLEVARAYRLPRGDRLRFVVLPAITPRIFVGMRMSLSLALLILVVSEMLGSTNGIGFFVMNAEQSYAIPQMWAGIILLGLLRFALNAVLEAVERRIVSWRR